MPLVKRGKLSLCVIFTTFVLVHSLLIYWKVVWRWTDSEGSREDRVVFKGLLHRRGKWTEAQRWGSEEDNCK